MKIRQSLFRLGLLLALVAVPVSSMPTSLMAAPNPEQIIWQRLGEENFEQSGLSVANVGDIDQDGTDDFAAGLRSVDASANGNHIAARIYSGATGIVLLELPAPAAHDQPSNNVVLGLGDLTGDNIPEIMVGTPVANFSVFTGIGLLRVFDGSNGAILKEWTANGVGNNAFVGASLAKIDDANKDGLDDIAVGAPGVDRVFVYSGKWTGTPGSSFEQITDISVADVGGNEETNFGFAVARVGIIDDSGQPAIVVGAPDHPNAGSRQGRIYVILVGARLNSGTIPNVVKYTKDGDGPQHRFGADVDGGLDINNDGTPDFLGSATGTPPEGPPGGTGYARTFSGANGNTLRTFTSDQPGDIFGFAAKFGNRCADSPTLLIGAPAWVNAQSKRVGRVLVYNVASGAEISQLAGEKTLENMGMSVAPFVDVNGDNHAEFLAGAPGTGSPPLQFGTGAAYVFSCVKLPRPNIVAAPDPADFGNVQTGESQDRVISITNPGTAPLQVSSISLVAPSSGFSILSGASAFTLNPNGAAHQVTVRFSPTTAGLKGGKLRIISNDPDTPQLDVALTGKGVLRQIEVTPQSIDFGNVDVGDTATALIKVKNVGNLPLSVSNITLPNDGGGLFTLALLPPFPKTLQPNQHFWVQARYAPTAIAGASGTANVASNAAGTPNVQVSLTGSGVAPNLRPTAVITMEVPYNENVIRFHGDGSFDPDGTIVSYSWDFGHDGATSNEMNPVHAFPCPGGAEPCRYIVRLTVTDNGGKSDPTSVTSLVFVRPLRSRFYGKVLQGGSFVPDGTVVSAHINGKKVAESLTQTHLGESVYAIEIPPDIHQNGEGGDDGDVVTFMVGKATAEVTGTFYSKTDQELTITAPHYVPPFIDIDWCIIAQVLGIDVCGPPILIPPGGIYLELEEWPRPPIPDPGPLRQIGEVFRLEFRDAATGQPITSFPQPYQITTRYTNAKLEAAGVQDESTIGLYYVQNGRWVPAGVDQLTPEYNKVTSAVDHASIFALFGEPVGPRKVYLPVIQTSP